MWTLLTLWLPKDVLVCSCKGYPSANRVFHKMFNRKTISQCQVFFPISCSCNQYFLIVYPTRERNLFFKSVKVNFVTSTLAYRWHTGTKNSNFDLMGSLRKSSSPLSGFLIAMLTNLNIKVYYGAMVEFIYVTEENCGTRCYLNTEISEPDVWPPCHLERIVMPDLFRY